MNKAIKQYWHVAPYLLLGTVLSMAFAFYPMLKGIHMSFFNYNIINPAASEFLGFDHYTRLFQDDKFYKALLNTVVFGLVTVPGQWILGLILAIFINLKFIRFKVFFRAIYYVPVISSWIVVGYLFRYLFQSGSSGFVNYVLVDTLHILSTPVDWLQHTWTANLVVWVVSIWKGVGYVMVLYLAALQSIPRSLYEAAEIDGAKGVQSYVYITLPLMKPMTVFVFINLIIGAVGYFLQVYLITRGDPLYTTHSLNSYLFKQAFEFFEFGYASAIALIMGLIVFIITYGFQRTFGQEKIEY